LIIICVGLAVLASLLSGYCFNDFCKRLKKGKTGNVSMFCVALVSFYVATRFFDMTSDCIRFYTMEKKSSYVEATLVGINPKMRYGLTSIGFVRFAEGIPTGKLDYLDEYYRDSVLVFKLTDNPRGNEKMVFEVKAL